MSKKQKKQAIGTALAKRLNLRLFRAILSCVEILTLGWIALVANNVFNHGFRVVAPVFVVMSVVYFALLLLFTLSAKERDMLLLCVVFYVFAAIGAAFVPCYARTATFRCGETEATDCIDQVYTLEQRNLYWIKNR